MVNIDFFKEHIDVPELNEKNQVSFLFKKILRLTYKTVFINEKDFSYAPKNTKPPILIHITLG